MKIISFISVITIAFAIGGCAGKNGLCSSRFAPLGPDTYMATGMHGNGCGYKYEIEHANTFCREQGKNIIVKNIDKKPGGGIVFQCLNTNDRDLQRPTYEKEPDIVIKTK